VWLGWLGPSVSVCLCVGCGLGVCLGLAGWAGAGCAVGGSRRLAAGPIGPSGVAPIRTGCVAPECCGLLCVATVYGPLYVGPVWLWAVWLCVLWLCMAAVCVAQFRSAESVGSVCAHSRGPRG
jgi:hypothetical protein